MSLSSTRTDFRVGPGGSCAHQAMVSCSENVESQCLANYLAKVGRSCEIFHGCPFCYWAFGELYSEKGKLVFPLAAVLTIVKE